MSYDLKNVGRQDECRVCFTDSSNCRNCQRFTGHFQDDDLFTATPKQAKKAEKARAK